MASQHIRNPAEWAWDQLRGAAIGAESTYESVRGTDEAALSAFPTVHRIAIHDLQAILAKGLEDTGAYRTDVFFLCCIYPVVGLVLMYQTFHYQFLPLLFPLVAGFALIGPVAAVGLYEMSRRREQGLITDWAHAFGVVQSRAFGAIAILGLILVAIFLLWLLAANGIYQAILGPAEPSSIGAFASDVFTTGAGWAMIIAGLNVGLLFSMIVLSISVISFPLLLDREVGLATAVAISIRAVTVNPGPMAVWGLIVVASLVVGSLPLLLGLIFVMPVLGHSTWHLYRKVVSFDRST
jgi:uncharacterized membrane protein